jgi:hypothetical protein
MLPPSLEDAPSWRQKMSAARQAGWLSLTPEEREVAAADFRVAREKRKAKRRQFRERARRINELVIAGFKMEEVAAAEAMPVTKLRYHFNGLLAARKGFRRLCAWLADDHVAALDDIAADLGIDRGRAVERLLAAVLSEDGFVARRQLGLRRKAEAA